MRRELYLLIVALAHCFCLAAAVNVAQHADSGTLAALYVVAALWTFLVCNSDPCCRHWQATLDALAANTARKSAP